MPKQSELLAGIPERPSNLAVIEGSNLFHGLASETKQELAANSFMAYSERGEMLFSAGTAADFFCLVGHGFVKMTKTSRGGQEVVLELLGPGQACGLLVALERRPFPLSATAVTHCWHLKVPMRAFQPIYESNASLRDQILRGLGPRLRKAHDMMLRFSSGRIEERIAVVLFLLADSYGEVQEAGVRIAVPLTRQDVSEMAGTTIETTIRVLSRWQKEELIATDHRFITLLDEAALQRIIQ